MIEVTKSEAKIANNKIDKITIVNFKIDDILFIFRDFKIKIKIAKYSATKPLLFLIKFKTRNSKTIENKKKIFNILLLRFNIRKIPNKIEKTIIGPFEFFWAYTY